MYMYVVLQASEYSFLPPEKWSGEKDIKGSREGPPPICSLQHIARHGLATNIQTQTALLRASSLGTVAAHSMDVYSGPRRYIEMQRMKCSMMQKIKRRRIPSH